MNTTEMQLRTQKDGSTYYSNDVKYQKDIDIVESDDDIQWPLDAWYSIDDLMNTEWTPYRTMTKSQAEEQFQIKIIN